jgi:cob(I)alamin adenosyltransferase
MVKLTKIYTRGGDAGETSLGSGARVSKFSRRVAAYGTVDETNSCIGLVRLHTQGEADEMLARIQNDLFDLGADLCRPEPKQSEKPDSLRITALQIERLEAEIDAINNELADLESFVLPGGSPASAHLHLARTVARRAERIIFELAETEFVNPLALKYINRLSDHIFVLSRALNDQGKNDVLWRPGANR